MNRVFKDKPGGLVVDYLGLADELKKALATYTESGGTGKTAILQAEAVAVMMEKHEICLGLFHGFDWSLWTTGTPQDRLSLLPAAQEYILKQHDGKNRLLAAVTALSQAFALAVPHEDALSRILRRRRLLPSCAFSFGEGHTRRAADLTKSSIMPFWQIISRAVVSDGVVDIFAAAGLKKPDISILSDEFLTEIRGMPQHNLAVELLQKLLRGEILVAFKAQRCAGIAPSRNSLEQTVRKYW